ncbi:hypothetical protein [uncultured Mediterranean phage uvDeep-CGR0-KM14-C182]|nr:hypothetical protein [uncultured Mediterranean phage uvDeep-CGR0-KM14-C182]
MFIVNVTQEDIDHGKPLDKYSCPIALALHRAGFPVCSVYTEFASIMDTAGHWTAYQMPEAAAAFVENFDRYIHGEDTSGVIHPFSFELGMSHKEWLR